MLSTVEKVLFLKSVDLFSKITGEDLNQVAGIAEEVNFEQDELIFQEGEMGDSLYLIVDGSVVVHRQAKEITRLIAKEAFG
jgi:CRP/FNR family cyclic AMP-dependent transcriptional regulator